MVFIKLLGVAMGIESYNEPVYYLECDDCSDEFEDHASDAGDLTFCAVENGWKKTLNNNWLCPKCQK